MWQKYLTIIVLFYIFALLQNSFFIHFDLFGATPNLVLALFLLIIFFVKKEQNFEIILWAAVAGFLLDAFSYTYLGPSMILLLVIGFFVKQLRLLLKDGQDTYPLFYFLPISLISYLAYELLLGLYLNFLDPGKMAIDIGTKNIFALIYNLIIAAVFFYLYKIIIRKHKMQW